MPPVEFLAEPLGSQSVMVATLVGGLGLAAVDIMTHVTRVVGWHQVSGMGVLEALWSS